MPHHIHWFDLLTKYHELSEAGEFSNVIFLKVDVDENPETAARYEVSAMPTFLFIKRGEVVDKLMGANPAALKEMLNDLAWEKNYNKIFT